MKSAPTFGARIAINILGGGLGLGVFIAEFQVFLVVPGHFSIDDVSAMYAYVWAMGFHRRLCSFVFGLCRL